MARTNFDLFVTYAHGVRPQDENFARTCDLCARLAALHPLLANISPKGRKGGWSNMEKEPLVRDMPFEAWLDLYNKAKKSADDRFGQVDSVGHSLMYWNRRRKPAYQFITIRYNVFDEDSDNDLFLTDIQSELLEPAIMMPLMQACIEAFDAHRAEYAWYRSGENRGLLYHKLWLKDGLPFPKGAPRAEDGWKPTPDNVYSGRYPLGHPPPPQSEPWHGGTLYTWPEHEPHKLMAELGVTPP